MQPTKTKITKEQLNLFVACGKHFINECENKSTNPLIPAIEAVLPEALKKLKKIEREKDIFKISLAKKTSSKHLDMDKHGRYLYTEEETKKLWEKMDAIDAEEVTIHSQIIDEYPEDGLTYDVRRGLEGVVIAKKEYPEYEEEEAEKEEQEID